jgi:D-psicose/D-tagatose/L-ribulose 3-epimerase
VDLHPERPGAFQPMTPDLHAQRTAESEGAPARRRFAICSETFAGMSFREACQAAQRAGYSGIEIEPAHLAADPAALTSAQRREIRRMMDDEGLAYVGLHSFLKAPPALHLTTPDLSVRQWTWDYFSRLIDLAAELGKQPIMVLGSGKQRQALNGSTPEDAVARLTEGLQRMAPAAEQADVCILIEPLAPHLCNVVHTLDEAMGIVRSVNSPAVQTIFDTHNTAGEQQQPEVLIRHYLPWIKHVHLNEMDGRRPGAGQFPFAAVLRTLDELNYSGWLSVEAFDFKPDGETVARLAREYLAGAAEPGALREH